MQRGRKSAAALAVVSSVPKIDGRPAAPKDLTKYQQQIWDQVVANEPATFFETAAQQQLLKEYCRHTESAHHLTSEIRKDEEAGIHTADLERLERLLRMRDKETKALADKATKLRLTNQSRYTPRAAGSGARKSSKPWDDGGD